MSKAPVCRSLTGSDLPIRTLRNMKREEFIERILKGERDFSNIRFEPRTFLSLYEEGFRKMDKYLRFYVDEILEDPVVLNDSEFIGVVANELFLPFVRGERAYMRRIHLERAYLRGADFKGVNLEGGFLWGVNLWGANLEGAYIQGANLEDAELGEANLRNAYLWGAYLGSADLRKADLEGANLGRAVLRRANLEGANLKNANLAEADLRWADLKDANLEGADLEGADLRGAYLKETNLIGVKNLSKAIHLEEAIFLNVRASEEDRRVIEEAMGRRPPPVKV